MANNGRMTFAWAVMFMLAGAITSCGAARESSATRSRAKTLAPTCASGQETYGVPLGAVTLANVEIGRDGRQMSYRFRATQSAAVGSVRVYVKPGPGYSTGDGGSIKADLETDDATARHAPSGHALGSASIGALLEGAFNRVLTFAPPVPLNAGTLYHLVFSNPSPDAAHNYTSLNDVMIAGNRIPPQLNDLAVLTKAPGDAGWTQFADHVPIFALAYTNGAAQGQGYIDAIAQGPAVGHVAGQNRVRENIAVQGAARVATQVSVWARNPGSTAAVLHLRLEDGAQHALAEGDVPVNSSTNFDWVTFPFAAPQTLASGQTYNLVLSAGAGNVDTIPVQAGSASGFDVPTLFSDGTYQLSNGSAWTAAGRNLQMQFYFCATAPPTQ